MPAQFAKPEIPTSLPFPLRLGIVALPWHLDQRGEHLGAGPEAILAAGLPGLMARTRSN